MIHKFPDGDILRDFNELPRKRVEKGLFTLFVKIRTHRGKFFNEKADRWVDQGVLAISTCDGTVQDLGQFSPGK